MGPNYPVFPSQPYSGKLPALTEVGPPDFLYSSSTAPFYADKLNRQNGRYLAGLGVAVQDEGAKTPEVSLAHHAKLHGADRANRGEPGTAAAELAYYRSLDDVQGDGIFDAPGTHPNIHPDAGIFAARFSLPGYHARERPYSMSEVRDVTTGRPIRAVPNGAVAMDSAAQVAFIEQGLYEAPRPLWSKANLAPIQSKSIVNVMQNPEPIGALPTVDVTWKTVLGALAAGAAIGAVVAMATKKKA